MKARVIRDKRGNAVASVLDISGRTNLVPLDVELDDDETPQFEDVELRTRDLFDLDTLYKRLQKKVGK